MYYPDSFYMYVPGEEEVFTRHPPGSLHVGRMITNQDAWRKRQPGLVKHKRPLFCNIQSKSLDKKQIIEALRILVRDGFEVYVLPELSYESYYRTPISIEPMRLHEDMLDTAEDNLWLDNIHSTQYFRHWREQNKHKGARSLTHFDMERLIGNKPKLQLRTMYIQDFTSAPTCSRPEDELSYRPNEHGDFEYVAERMYWMPDNEPNRGFTETRVIWSYFSSGKPVRLNDLFANRRYTHETQLRKVTLVQEHIVRLLQGDTLSNGYVTIGLADLALVETLNCPRSRGVSPLDLDIQSGEHALGPFLSHLPQLNNLFISKLQERRDWPTLPKLRTLTCDSVKYAGHLTSLLEKHPDLEHLKFGIMFTGSPFVDESWKTLSHCPLMPALKTLDIHLSKGMMPSGASSIVTAFLRATPNLEEFRFVNTSISLKPESLLTFLETCPGLQTINLGRIRTNKTKLNADTFASALNNYKNLRSIDLVWVPYFSSDEEMTFWQTLVDKVPALSPATQESIKSSIHIYKQVRETKEKQSTPAFEMPSAEELRAFFRDLAQNFKPEQLIEAMQSSRGEMTRAGINFADIAHLLKQVHLGDLLKAVGGIQAMGTLGAVGLKALVESGLLSELMSLKMARAFLFQPPRFEGGQGAASSSDEAPSTPWLADFDLQSAFRMLPNLLQTASACRGKHKALDYRMVEDRLGQFLTLQKMENEEALVPSVRQALPHLAEQFGPVIWQKALTFLNEWDGRAESLTKTHITWLNRIQEQATVSNPSSQTWLGDGVIDWLATQDLPCTLSSPWRAVTVFPVTSDAPGVKEYIVYDPQFEQGQLQVSHQALPELLNKVFGPLTLVSVHARSNAATPSISCNRFLEEGGLLALLRADNCSDVMAQFGHPPLLNDLSAAALQSLMLRTTDGTPAWLAVLESQQTELISLVLTLLSEYLQQNLTNYWELLEQSMVERKDFTREQMLALLCDSAARYADALAPETNNILSEFQDLTVALALEESDRQALRSRRQQTDVHPTLESYCDVLLQKSGSHRIEMPNADTLHAFKLALLQQSIESSRPVIFINRPDELMCSNPFVERQKDQITGVFIDQPPAGPMRDALTAGGKPPLIVLNSDNFTPISLIQFNTLLDDRPSSDGVDFPAGTGVLLLENGSNPSRHRGGEFYSRIGSWETYPFEAGTPPLPNFPPCAMSADDEPYRIDLYTAIDWKEQLLGYWAPRKDRMEWIPGKLELALQQNRPIVLANAPLEKRDCYVDLHAARKRGHFNHEGLDIPYPPGGFGWGTGYDWDTLAQSVTSWRVGVRPGAVVLNSYNLTDFSMRYVCEDASREVDTIDGLIKAHAGQRMEVNLTHALDGNQFARLLDECRLHQVDLSVNAADEQLLPEELRTRLPPAEKALPPLEPVPHTMIVRSNDPDVTRRKLGYDRVLAIDISECNPAQLLNSIDGFFERSSLKLRFHNTRGLLPDMLEQYETVVLRGQFTEEHAQALTPFLLDRMTKTDGHPSALLLLPDNPKDLSLSFLPFLTEHVSRKEKLHCLSDLCNPADLPADKLASEPLCKLEARARFQRHSPSLSTDLAWEGLEDLPNNLNMGPPDFANSEAIAGAFVDKRIHDLFARVNVSPLVVLVGLTGVGKSTLIEKELANRIGRKPWLGWAEIRQWAADKRPGRKYIFLDEANMGGRKWSEIEGLFERPRHIRVDNEILELDDDHVVITASNPVSYGDNRSIAPLFLRHGNVLVLDPIPLEFLYEMSLKPLFIERGLENEMEAACSEILRLYAFFCQHSKDKVLISPRELEEIALLILANRKPDEPLMQTTQYYVRMIGETLAEGPLRKALDLEFPPNSLRRPAVLSMTQPLVPTVKPAKPFRYTPSRWPVTNLLESLIALREMRVQQQHSASDAFLHGGLGGVILEGSPGIGKSDQIRHLFSMYGYSPDNPDKPLYTVPSSMHIDAKKALLLKAHEEGAVEFQDEINASERPEEFLNDLYMHKHPITKARPARPGFIAIATQNPISDGARIQGSNAASRRVITVQVPDYPPNEMVELLQDAQLTRARAQVLVNITQKENLANQNDRSKQLNFRDLLRYAWSMVNGAEHVEASEVEQLESSENVLLPVRPSMAATESPAAKEAFDKLIAAIQALKVHGQLLKTSRDPLSRTTGHDAVILANSLRDAVVDLRQNPGSRPRYQQLEQRLQDGYNEMSRHRNCWVPLLYNIYLATQGFLWFVLDVRRNGGFFSPRTKRQDMVNDIMKAMQGIEEEVRGEQLEPI